MTAKETEIQLLIQQYKQHSTEQHQQQSDNAKQIELLLNKTQSTKTRLEQDMGQLERQYINDKENYQAQLAQRESDIEHLKQTLAHEQLVAQTHRQEYESTVMSQLSEQQQRVKVMSTHLAAHKDEIERLNRASRTHEEEKEVISCDVVKMKEIHAQEVNSLQKDLKELFMANNELRCYEASCRENMVTIDRLDKEKQTLIESHCNDKQTLHAEYESTVDSMKQQFSDLSSDKQQLARTVNELTEQIQIMTRELSEYQKTVKTYAEEKASRDADQIQQALADEQIEKLQQNIEHIITQQVCMGMGALEGGGCMLLSTIFSTFYLIHYYFFWVIENLCFETSQLSFML